MKRKDNNSVGILSDQREAATPLNINEYIKTQTDEIVRRISARFQYDFPIMTSVTMITSRRTFKSQAMISLKQELLNY